MALKKPHSVAHRKFLDTRPKPPMHPLPGDYENGREDAAYLTDYAAYLLDVDAHDLGILAWESECARLCALTED